MHQLEKSELRPLGAHPFDRTRADAAPAMGSHPGRFVDHQ
jgi:hypothetical protein